MLDHAFFKTEIELAAARAHLFDAAMIEFIARVASLKALAACGAPNTSSIFIELIFQPFPVLVIQEIGVRMRPPLKNAREFWSKGRAA
jgi:hypothetical protein